MIGDQLLSVIDVVVNISSGGDQASQQEGQERQLADDGTPAPNLTVFKSETLYAGI
jgi:hypothetical protein